MNATSHVQTARPDNLPAFVGGWAALTAAAGLLTTLTSSHSFILYWMALLTGLITGLGQWWLLRGYIDRAWRWVVASAGGWLLGVLLAVGVPWGLGLMYVARQSQSPGPVDIEGTLWLVKAMEIFVYTFVFGVLGATQAIPMRRQLAGVGVWIVLSAAAGTLLGTVMQLMCTLGDADLLTTRLLVGQMGESGTMCVNIGLTLPRLQTSEPLFNVLPLSWAAHALGWAVYGLVTAAGMGWLLRSQADTD